MATSNVVISEGQVTFKRTGGHNHDGLTSTLIDTSKYSIFDFVVAENALDSKRRQSQGNRKEMLKSFIISTVEERVLKPTGILIQANTISAREIISGTITANELSSNIVLVDNVIRSKNYINNTNTFTGWAIYSNGEANFNNVNIRGNLKTGNGFYGQANTPLYADNIGQFSLGNKFIWNTTANSLTINAGSLTLGSNLSWDGNTLTITGNVTLANTNIGTFNNGDSITDGFIGGININEHEIQSIGFIADSVGFRISDSGDAEFNDVKIRGTISASTISGNSTVTIGTWSNAGGSTGLKLDSSGYITGSGGGVKIRNYGTNGTDGATGTLLFGDSIQTGSMSLNSISITPNGTDEVNIGPSGTTSDIEITTGGIQVGNGKTISATTAFYSSGSGTIARMQTTGGIQYLTGGSSSRHLKENIRNLEDGISILKTLKPKVYNFKVDAFQDNDPITGEPWTEEARQLANFDIKYGLILEDVLEVRPELISYIHEKTEIPYDQEGGYADISSWKPQMWEEADVLVLCVKAIQELSAKNEELEARIQTLEGV